MLKNYLKIAFRSLLKNKLFSFINIFGLGLSISVCLMVIINVKEHLSFDTFHPQPENTYRIITETKNKEGNSFLLASSPLPMKGELTANKDLIANGVTIYPSFHGKGSYNEKSITINGAFTEPSFFEVFGFTLESGHENTALKGANQLVLSKKTAEKYFGTEDPIGKVIDFNEMGSFIVSGVLDELPGNSHIDFEAYASLASVPLLEKNGSLGNKFYNWFSFYDAFTYILVKEGAGEKDLNRLLASVNHKVNKLSNDETFAFSAQRLDKITPGTDRLRNNIGKGTVWSKFWAEVGIGMIILLSACFNYTNLTLGKALTRSKEVGIRKVAGAQRYQVFLQYITEAVIVSFCSLLLGLFLFSVIQNWSEGEGFQNKLSVEVLLWFLVFALATGAIAGSLPAWVLSSLKPVNVLKNVSTKKIFGNITLRKILIVFQFSLSLVIIIFLTAFYQQFSYMETIDPGFRKENIVSIPLDGVDKNILRNEIAQISGVGDISFTSTNFGRHETGNVNIGAMETKSGWKASFYYIDENTVPVMNLQIVAGNNLDDLENEEKYVLLNEKSVKALGFKTNEEAVGKIIWYDTTQVVVKGIVKDFYFHNVGNPVTPLVLRSKKDAYNFMNVSIKTNDRAGISKQLAKAWKKAVPKQGFSYFWLEDRIKELGNQKSAYSFLGYLAFIAITIAVLGLLGLVVYTVETRRKEIEIRKIVGANISQIITLISNGFTKLLLIAGVISLPIGYLLTYIFLQNFYNRITLRLENLLLCFFFLFTIGVFTIISQILPVANASPVKGLREE